MSAELVNAYEPDDGYPPDEAPVFVAAGYTAYTSEYTVKSTQQRTVTMYQDAAPLSTTGGRLLQPFKVAFHSSHIERGDKLALNNAGEVYKWNVPPGT